MNKTYKLPALWMMCLMLFSGLSFTACCNGEDEDTNQFLGGVNLNVFGPCPVARGGELRFIGSGMDKITSVEIPGSGDVTEIKVISNEEIRVTVPQTATQGLIVLNWANGTITTKTEITFTEPIELEAVTPATIKAGEVLTITGDYLNLIGEVIFVDDVTVLAEDFISQSRKEIKLTVPAEAQTGKIIISDGAEIPNWIYSADELIVTLPAVEEALDLTGKKPGETIIITGKDLDLVKAIRMPNGDEVEFVFETKEAGQTISFVLPDNMTDGEIVMIPASGVAVVIARIGMALPTDVVATPATELRGGAVITLTGKSMELITDITFPGVEAAVAPDAQSATEVKVTMPDAAISGNLLLNTGSGASVEVAIETQKPEFGSYVNDAVSLGNEIGILGKNLDLVAKVIFTGGAEMEVTAQSPTSLTFTMPTMNVETGVLTLVMANGETVETSKLTIESPEFCFIPVLPGEDEELRGGEVLDIQVENGDKLTGVQVNGQTVQFIINGSKLYISVPQVSGKGSKVTLISSNGSIDYTIDFIPATEIENIIMNEMTDLGSWGKSFSLTKTDLVNAGFAAGAKLRFFVKTYGYTQIQINHANWGSFTTIAYNADDCPPVIEFDVTQEFYDFVMNTDDGWGDTGIIIQGEGCIVDKVSVWYEISLETTVWSGPVTLTWGEGGRVVVPAAVFNGVKANAKLRFYFGQITDVWAQAQINDGSWGGLVFEEVGSNTLVPTNDEWFGWTFDTNRVVELKLTRDILDQIAANAGAADSDYPGAGLIIQGSDLIFNKVTIE
ncbi:hypothetical protein [Bacteroides sp. 51]|uniref:hypothetical protein n=1 Tax=Bacteroides sp. 51 TaxID=2302938 RepID=UPI0013D4EC2F|nr:hypothetical protein [Bacteroides sp. 51]NDV83162.1 hypothetical protein [Bacteroides sp. 51]